jgi:stearoyl-CoA desaturase (delta-9 desaturase)
LAGIIGTGVAIWLEGFSWGMFLFGLVFAILTNLSITTGYHRLFSHRSYEANPLMKGILVFIGTGAWQSSVLKWCTDHRVHHSEVDTDDDPYSIHKGFWFAHLGWMFWKEKPGFKINVPDLEKDGLLRFQHNHYVKCAIAIGFLMPWFIGWLCGYPLTGLFMCGALRIGLTQQSTFFVNSLCHTLGRQTYSDQISARDSLFVAFLTHGEGYHNFHHKFQFDYRNGIRWWHWDPTKWTIEFMAWLGMARKLRTVSQTEILKAQLQMDALKLSSKGYSQEKLEHLREQMVRAQMRVRALKEDYQKAKAQYFEDSREKLQALKAEIKIAKIELQYGLATWRTLMRAPVPIQISKN